MFGTSRGSSSELGDARQDFGHFSLGEGRRAGDRDKVV